MIDLTFRLEDVIIRAEDAASGYHVFIDYRTHEDLQEFGGLGDDLPHRGKLDLGVLDAIQLSAILSLAAGIGEHPDADEEHVDRLYSIVEPILDRAECPSEAWPIP